VKPIKRHYPEQPLVGVGAVIFKGEEVLLVRRGQEPAQGTWSLPGGAVEGGESLKGAVGREIKEETGLSVKILGITAVLDRIYHDAEGGIPYHYVLVDFLCSYDRGDLTPASDITAARFVPLNNLPQYDLPQFTAVTIRRAWEQKRAGTFLAIIK
jgi:ADP-ribose pyrophosphatase YjhB (NUDIX family)